MHSKLSPSCVEAFNNGFEAAFNGQDEFFDNHYPRGSDESMSFLDGYQNFFEQQEANRLSRYLKDGPVVSVDPVMARLQEMSMADLGRLIGFPAQDWPSRCFEIASAIVKALEWDNAAAVYGLYLGAISSNCTVFEPSSEAMVRHGWIVTKEGFIVDPTAWVFEGVDPYLKVLQPRTPQFYECLEHYDEGAESLSSVARQGCPAFVEGDEVFPVESQSLLQYLQQLVRREAGLTLAMHPAGFTRPQLGWLCRTAYTALGITRAAELYAYVLANGLTACIPVDFRARAERNARWQVVDE